MILAAALMALQVLALNAGWNDLGSEYQEGLVRPWIVEPLATLEPLDVEIETPDGAAIEALIDALVTVAAPDFGYSGTVAGSCFLPWPAAQSVAALLWLPDGHGLDSHPALRRLEELGPHALPHLLAHLDDARETQLTFGPDERHGALRLERGVAGNPLNAREARALGEYVTPRWSMAMRDGDEASVTLTVGDLCFVALGQIANRPNYMAARYQPSGHVVVTSPARDPWLAEALRRAWGDDDPHDGLLRSLLLDFQTRGQGTDELQAGAALRLAYYFPRDAAPILVERLDGLHVGLEDGEFYDGVRAEALLEALSSCSTPPIAAAVARARARADASPPRAPSTAAYRGKNPGPRRALRAAWRAGGEVARAAFESALASEDPAERARACRVLTWAPGDRRSALRALRPLIEDVRPTGERYVGEPEGPGWVCVRTSESGLHAFGDFGEATFEDLFSDEADHSSRARVENLYVPWTDVVPWDDSAAPVVPVFRAERFPLRVCDEASLAVASILGVSFRLEGGPADLDEQRASLVEELERELNR